MKSDLTNVGSREANELPLVDAWLAGFSNRRARRVHQNYVREFMEFAEIEDLHAFEGADSDHVLAWCRELERRGLRATTILRKLVSLSLLFDSLLVANIISDNPVKSVGRWRPKIQAGKTFAIGEPEARLKVSTCS